MAELRLVLVTPEKTLFDRPVASVRLPMFDGLAGYYPGRAPLVGRLGIGELRLSNPSGGYESYFIDGGFVQVKGDQISVLTNFATASTEISRSKAGQLMAEAKAVAVRTDEEYDAAARKLERARKMLSLSERE